MKEQIVKDRHHRGDGASFFLKERADATRSSADRTHEQWQTTKDQISKSLGAQHGVHDTEVFNLMSTSRERRLAFVAASKVQEEARQEYTQNKNMEWLITVFADLIGDMYYEEGTMLYDDETIIDIIFRHCEEWVTTTRKIYKDTEEAKRDIESNIRSIIYSCLRGLPKSSQSVGAKGYDTKPGIEKVPKIYDLAEYVAKKTRPQE